MTNSIQTVRRVRGRLRVLASSLLEGRPAGQSNLGMLFLTSAVLLHRKRGRGVLRSGSLDIATELAILRKVSPTGYLAFSKDGRLTNLERVAAQIQSGLSEVPESHTDDVLSWLFQYLKEDEEKAAFKDALESSVKISGDALLAATQFFTDKYMVKYLVAGALENFDLTEEMLSNLCLSDPACGGGNFLVVAFEEIFVRARAKELARPEQIISLLFSNIIFGLDLDPILTEVAKLNLYLKATELLGRAPEQLPLNIFTPFDKTLGILNKDYFKHDATGIERRFIRRMNTPATIPIIVTNPPFMGPRLMGPELKSYLQNNYPASNGDLCFAFLDRCADLIRTNGSAGLVTQAGWTFLNSLDTLRKKLFEANVLRGIVNLGTNAFLDIDGEKTNVTLVVLGKRGKNAVVNMLRLNDYPLEEKARRLAKAKQSDIISFRIPTRIDSGAPSFALTQAGVMSRHFQRKQKYSEFARPMQGTSTGDNKLFVKFAWEAPLDGDWKPVSKGGGFCRWAGLNRYRVLWGKSGEFIRKHPGSALRNINEAQTAELVFSDTGTLGLNVRMKNRNQVFIASGPGIKVLKGDPYAHLAFLNSRLATYFIRQLSPKLTISAGYIGELPAIEKVMHSRTLARWARQCSELKSAYLSVKLGNDEYRYIPNYSLDIASDLARDFVRDLKNELQILRLEHAINREVQDAYNLPPNELLELDRMLGVSVFALPRFSARLENGKLDGLLSSILSSTCEYVGGRPNGTRIGCGGVLEDLSYRLNTHPESIFKAIVENIDGLQLTLRKYRDDAIHKVIIGEAGFISNTVRNMRSEPSTVVRRTAARTSLPSAEITDWVGSTFDAIHQNTFLGRGVVTSDCSSRHGIKVSVLRRP